MTALALTPATATASVLLQVTGAPAGALTITRVDSNGVNIVRLLAGQVPIAGVLTVTDYEPALDGALIRYDVRDFAAVITSASTTLVGVSAPQLSTAVLPAYRQELALVTGYDAARQGATTVHTIIGRADPVVTMGELALRTGTLTCWAPDHPTARAIEALADLGEVLLLRQPDHPGMDLYFAATRTQIRPDTSPTTPRRWSVDLTFVEVDCPTGPLLGALGWTFDDVTAYASFAALPAVFGTFTELTTGAP